MSEEELDSIEILTNTDISTIELAENVDLITYSYAVKTVLNLIEKLRIKNGKEFVRGVETNEKLWRTKINNKLKELAEKLVEPNDDRWEKDDDLYYEKIKARINVLKDLKGE